MSYWVRIGSLIYVLFCVASNSVEYVMVVVDNEWCEYG